MSILRFVSQFEEDTVSQPKQKKNKINKTKREQKQSNTQKQLTLTTSLTCQHKNKKN
jgi:hypothetical protein